MLRGNIYKLKTSNNIDISVSASLLQFNIYERKSILGVYFS